MAAKGEGRKKRAGTTMRKTVDSNLEKRMYLSGDEGQINALYKLITGNERTTEEYRWEWLDTWKGQGSMWLAFDESREPGDQLIMQYSLIPTPISFWGKRCLAGKTENCMCHPDYRSTGKYFSHEKAGFEKAQKRFQAFFTTSGNFSNGAAGAVRRKLGYKAFDSWTNYLYCANSDALKIWLYSKLAKRMGSIPGFTNALAVAVSKIVGLYCSLFYPKKLIHKIKVVGKNQAPMKEIERFWKNNMTTYGISVDRTSRYLDWRINQNPYVDHEYLLYYENAKLIGYMIFYCHKNAVYIVDLLSENGDIRLLKEMVKFLVKYAYKKEFCIITSAATKNNEILKRVFWRCGFVNDRIFASIITIFRPNNKNPFHVFISKDLLFECFSQGNNILLPKNWYITGIVREGRAPRA